MVLLDILRQNYFSRTAYFSGKSDSSHNIFLTPNSFQEGTVFRIAIKPIDNTLETNIILNNLESYNIQKNEKENIIKSRDAIKLLNQFRWAYYSFIYILELNKRYHLAKIFIKQMNEKFDLDKLPFASKEQEDYHNYLINQAEKN